MIISTAYVFSTIKLHNMFYTCTEGLTDMISNQILIHNESWTQIDSVSYLVSDKVAAETEPMPISIVYAVFWAYLLSFP